MPQKKAKKERTDSASPPPSPLLEADIKSTGFYHNKAKNIQACCRILAEWFEGQVPADLNLELTTEAQSELRMAFLCVLCASVVHLTIWCQIMSSLKRSFP